MEQYRKYTAALFKRVTSLSKFARLISPHGSSGEKVRFAIEE